MECGIPYRNHFLKAMSKALEVFTPTGAEKPAPEYDWTEYSVTGVSTDKGYDFTVTVCANNQEKKLTFSTVIDENNCLKFADSYI
jgi:hypothetical protein